MKNEFKKDEFIINTDKRKLDFKTIHNFLTNCYWSKGISMKFVKEAAKNSMCFGVYQNKKKLVMRELLQTLYTLLILRMYLLLRNTAAKDYPSC